VFVGYFARLLGGVDIAWLVGLIVSGGVYWLLSRSLDLRAEEKIIRSMKESDFAAIAQRVQGER
jgi:NCS1 family nucleobase:cation symporter-1